MHRRKEEVEGEKHSLNLFQKTTLTWDHTKHERPTSTNLLHPLPPRKVPLPECPVQTTALVLSLRLWSLQCYPPSSVALPFSLSIQTLVPHLGVPTRSMSLVCLTFKFSVHLSWALPCPVLCAQPWDAISVPATLSPLPGPFASLEVSLIDGPSVEQHKEKWKHSRAVREMLGTAERSRGHLALSPPKLPKLFLSREKGHAPGNLSLWFGVNSPTPLTRKVSEVFFLDLFEEKPIAVLLALNEDF